MARFPNMMWLHTLSSPSWNPWNPTSVKSSVTAGFLPMHSLSVSLIVHVLLANTFPLQGNSGRVLPARTPCLLPQMAALCLPPCASVSPSCLTGTISRAGITVGESERNGCFPRCNMAVCMKSLKMAPKPRHQKTYFQEFMAKKQWRTCTKMKFQQGLLCANGVEM